MKGEFYEKEFKVSHSGFIKFSFYNLNSKRDYF